jgi:exosortase
MYSDKISFWLPIIVGLLALYIPTYYGLSTGLWGFEDQAHGPIVFMVVLYLVWQKREAFLPNSADKPKPIIGSMLFAFGLVCYVVGRSQDILFLDIGSQVFVCAGILLLTRGQKALNTMWFPLFFILFMIPLPGIFLDAVTLPMKIGVSYFTELILFNFNYPIARSGVILQIGQY